MIWLIILVCFLGLLPWTKIYECFYGWWCYQIETAIPFWIATVIILLMFAIRDLRREWRQRKGK